MNFIKYLTWNIKKYKKLIFNIFISILIGFVFSGCEVQAVNIVNSVPSSDVSKIISTDQFNNIIYELYNESIDISSYSNLSSLYLDNTSYFKGLFQLKRRSDGKLFPAVGVFSGTNAKFYCDINGRYSTKYYFEMQYSYIINTENNSVDRIIAGFGDLVDTSTVYTYLEKDLNYLMYQLATDFGITSSEFLNQDYQSTLFFNFFDWFNGKFYKNNVTISNGNPSNSNTSIQINNQEHFKRDYFEYSEGGYVSGDLTLYDDYLEIKGLETSYPNLNLYLLRFPVVYNSYDNYQISGPIELQSISSINISTESQTWEIGNPFPADSGENDYIYAFGIKNTSEPSFGILSEYFSEKGELQADIINSIPFRNKYYVQIFDQFFIPKEVSGGYPSGDTGGVVTNPDGGDTDLTGGITGIWQAIINLPKTILDGLVGLFVPSEGFFSAYFDELLTWFEERLGILGYPITFTVDVLNRILDLDFNEPVISWDDMYVPLFEDEVPLIPAGEINFKTLVESNETILNFYNTYLIIVDGLLVFMIIKLIQRKHDEIVGGASE